MPPLNLVWHFPIIIRLKNHNPLTCIINKKFIPTSIFAYLILHKKYEFKIQCVIAWKMHGKVAWRPFRSNLEFSVSNIDIWKWKFHECFHVLGNFHVQIERFVQKPFPSNDMQIKHVKDCTSSYCTYIYTWNQLIRKWPIRG